MRVAKDAEVRMQVYCRILLVVGCCCNNDADGLHSHQQPVLVIKLKCIPSYDGRLSEHWQYDIYYGPSLKINIAVGNSFVRTYSEDKGGWPDGGG